MSSKIWAVVPSAGCGQRMRQSLPKQYLPINNRTVIEHTLALLQGETKITQTTVCLAENDKHWPSLPMIENSELENNKLGNIKTTLGGTTRAHSVLNGILSIADQADKNDWLLVHDAARPCLSRSLLSSFIDQLRGDEVGGILALPSTDTVKFSSSSDGTQRIEKTLDRDRIWYAQTPQMFRYGLLKEALQQAIAEDSSVTDEASAMELAGYQPRLIVGEASNLKITRADDLLLAESLLTNRKTI